MRANNNPTSNSNHRQSGIVLLLISVVIGTIMLFLDWFQIPYTADSTIGHLRIATYPIKLIDVLFHTVAVPAGIAQPNISSAITDEIYVYIIGIVFWAICAMLAVRKTRSLRWLFGVGIGYVILVGCLVVPQQMWMGLSALSDPYVGVKPTIFQWLLLPYCGGILSGSYLISKS